MKTTEKSQRTKVGVAGNLINQLMGNNNSLPVVGKGATEMLYSDRHCYEVIEVSPDGKTVKLEALDARFDPAFGKPEMGHQNWILEPTGRFINIVWRNNAWRRKVRQVDFTKEFRAEAEANGCGVAVAKYLKEKDPDLLNKVYGDHFMPLNVIPGVTREAFSYPVIKILFGVKDYRYDWEF